MKYLLFFAAFLPSAQATLLYSTDFDNFPVGDNQWAGTDGWVITDAANGISFIDNTGFGGSLGNYAALGLEQPNSRRVSVLKQILHDHSSTGESIIEVNALVSVRDSSNGFYDNFYLSFFNSNVKRMATIRFDNREIPFGIWREQGDIDNSTLIQFDTLTDFIHEEIDELFISINLSTNTWSAALSGLPLFENTTFTTAANPADINLGVVGFEWQVSSPFTFSHGDNFLLVADYAINAFNPNLLVAPTPEIANNGQGTATLTWQGIPGNSYQIEYSDDLVTWLDDLPDSSFPNVPEAGTLTYSDASAPAERYYRIVLN